MTSPRRAGFALVLTVLLLLVLSIMTAGLLVLAVQEVHVVRARAAALRARLAAESAARAAIAGWPHDRVQELEHGEFFEPAGLSGNLPGDASYRTAIERLGRTMFLIRGEGSVPLPGGMTATARTGVVVTTVDPGPLDDIFPAALAALGEVRLTAGAQVLAQSAVAATADDCPGWPPSAPALVLADPAGLTTEPGATIAGTPDVLVTLAPWHAFGESRTARLGVANLSTVADHVVHGAVQPGPVVDGDACRTGLPHNWGAPLGPASPCADFFPLVVAPGDLAVGPGEGQGVLLTAGDLTVLGGTEFHGAVLVGGSFHAEAGAVVAGGVLLLDAASSAHVQGAAIRFDPCAVHRAFHNARAFRTPFPIAGRAWIPLF